MGVLMAVGLRGHPVPFTSFHLTKTHFMVSLLFLSVRPTPKYNF